jgi:hypothetical protein
MRGRIRIVVWAWLAAPLALLAVSCSSAATAPPTATAQTCYAFGVRALQQHITVTTVPRACAGLSAATVNLAVDRAVHLVVGPRPKAAARRLADREGARLAYLIRTVRPARPVSPAPPPGPGSREPLRVAALVAWLVTATAGSYLLAGWLRNGGLRRGRGGSRTGGLPPVIILGHFGVAVTGLGLWIAFMASDLTALAWTAAALLLPTAGLGMATLVTALPEPAESASPPSAAGPGPAGPQSAGPESAGPESAGPGPAGPDPGRLAARIAATAAPARVRMPVTVIALHGVLATATMLLVLLAAIGVS